MPGPVRRLRLSHELTLVTQWRCDVGEVRCCADAGEDPKAVVAMIVSAAATNAVMTNAVSRFPMNELYVECPIWPIGSAPRPAQEPVRIQSKPARKLSLSASGWSVAAASTDTPTCASVR